MPGVCENAVGYWHVGGARLVYRQHGQERSIGIASLISWRGRWYVVHFGAVLRASPAGVVDSPAAGPGVPGPAGGRRAAPVPAPAAKPARRATPPPAWRTPVRLLHSPLKSSLLISRASWRMPSRGVSRADALVAGIPAGRGPVQPQALEAQSQHRPRRLGGVPLPRPARARRHSRSPRPRARRLCQNSTTSPVSSPVGGHLGAQRQRLPRPRSVGAGPTGPASRRGDSAGVIGSNGSTGRHRPGPGRPAGRGRRPGPAGAASAARSGRGTPGAAPGSGDARHPAIPSVCDL